MSWVTFYNSNKISEKALWTELTGHVFETPGDLYIYTKWKKMQLC
jgi:hypothetical protein